MYIVDGSSACKWDYYDELEERPVWYRPGDVDGDVTIDGVMSVKGQWRYSFSYQWNGEKVSYRWRPLEVVWRVMKWLVRMKRSSSAGTSLEATPAEPPQLPAPQQPFALLPAKCA
jgi:hypothetical protein